MATFFKCQTAPSLVFDLFQINFDSLFSFKKQRTNNELKGEEEELGKVSTEKYKEK